MSKWIHECALGMYNIAHDKKEDILPKDLHNFLDDVEMYANATHGSIQSRQVVAIAMVAYRRIRKMELEVRRSIDE